MTRVLLADDEAPARERLRGMLATYQELEVVGEAATGSEAIALAAQLRPDLLILDIQMPGGTGLDVAACLPSPRPAIIFCTAYDQHAVEAFELNAVDYLLKPVSRARLAQALTRVSATAAAQPAEREAALDRVLSHSDDRVSRFLVRSGAHYLVVPAHTADWFEAADGLTRLVAADGRDYWMDPPLNELETRLDPGRFFRISRAAIVNLTQVAEVHPMPGGSAELVLRSGTRLEVSRRRVRDLMQAIEQSH